MRLPPPWCALLTLGSAVAHDGPHIHGVDTYLGHWQLVEGGVFGE